MRKVGADIGSVRFKVSEMIGESLDILLSPGRNKFSSHTGSIGELYPALFTLNLTDGEGDKARKITCSYSDVLCGKVRLERSKS